MMNSYNEIKKYCDAKAVKLVAISKTKTAEEIKKIYKEGQLDFGENKVQELTLKYDQLPKQIRWHLVGHLQSNKVKYIAPFISLIHSVDSFALIEEINKHAKKNNRVIDLLLQIHIAKEETKFGLSFEEAKNVFENELLKQLQHINIRGLMGMATLSQNEMLIRKEFKSLKFFFDQMKSHFSKPDSAILSMGMSSDYKIAIDEGSNMVRVGSAIFGAR